MANYPALRIQKDNCHRSLFISTVPLDEILENTPVSITAYKKEIVCIVVTFHMRKLTVKVQKNNEVFKCDVM